MHSIVTTFREAVIKVEIANFGAAIDTLIDQDGLPVDPPIVYSNVLTTQHGGEPVSKSIQGWARKFVTYF